jgi:hypothetical protein
MGTFSTPHRAGAKHHRHATTRARAGDARLRARAVSRPGCLGSLDPESRTLFTLRAGLNGSPQSRIAVARRLGLSPLREQLVEQISLLEFQGSTGGICAGQIAGDTLRPTIRLTSTSLGRGTT